MSKLTFNSVAREICKREESNSREVNITDVSRVMRHLFDILGEYPVIQQATNGKNDDSQWELGLKMGAGISFAASEISKRYEEYMSNCYEELTGARKSRKAATGKKGR